MIFLDFETRSEVDIKACGAWVYAEHPSTDVLCMAFAFDNAPVDLWLPGEPIPFAPHKIDKAIFEAHNAFFERAIWANVMVKKYGWPAIHPDQWRCSAAKAAARALPRSLEGAGAALGCAIQKDSAGKAVMLKVSRPRKATKNDSSLWNTDPVDMMDLYEYCKTDVEAERAIHRSVRDLSPLELRVWQLDQKINERGVYLDKEAAEAALELIARQTDKLTTEAQLLTEGAIKTTGQRDKVLQWLKDQDTALEGYTKQHLTEALAGVLPDKVRRLLEIRQQLGKTSTAKFQAMVNSVCSDGRIRDTLMYHGATTGRWTGKLVQLQNIPRGTIKDPELAIEIIRSRDLEMLEMLYGNVMATIASCIRGMLIAGPGCDFVVADYAAIETRVLFWLAGEARGLQMYRENEDLYVDMASAIYRKTPEQITKDEREMGKRAVLGCGYSMGGPKFKATCKTFANVEIDDQFALYVVQKYREKYAPVPRLWYAQENAAVEAVRYPNKIVQCGKVSWLLERIYLEGRPNNGGAPKTWANFGNEVLYCRLPSGRKLAYNSPEVKIIDKPWGGEGYQLSYMGIDSKTKQWTRQHSYGGMLVENITQAVARDLMAEAMLRVEDAGYPVVLSVHDELICEVPSTKNYSIEEFRELMCTLPAWANGLPVKAEGWRGKRYAKN